MNDSFGKNKQSPVDPVRILCAADANYSAQLCVMLVSLLIHHAAGRKIEIYVLANHIPDEDRKKIAISLCENRADFELSSLHWIRPNMETFEGMRDGSYVGINTYLRLLAPRVLPENCDKILYLDSDMVIVSDLSPLYDSNCGDSAVHAVRDHIGFVSGTLGVFNYAELGIAPDAHYFNAGVLLMNIRLWRERNLADRVIDYIKKYRGLMHLADQGGMNAIFHDCWTELDPVWNQKEDILHPKHWKNQRRSMADWKRAINHPKIIHYTGINKPWNGDKRPRYSYFFNYLARTRYRNTYKGPWLERLIGFKLNYFLYRFRRLIFRQFKIIAKLLSGTK